MWWPKCLTYGNWGGPGWSGGKFVHDVTKVDWSIPAIDDMDKAFKWHDAMWQSECKSKLEADVVLLNELLNLKVKGWWPNIFRIGSIIGFWITTNLPWRKTMQLIKQQNGKAILLGDGPLNLQQSDANTKLLLHCNRSLTDVSGYKNAISIFGDTQLDTTAKKFGIASVKFDGNGDYFTVLGTHLAVGSGDFTVEAWIQWLSVTNALLLGMTTSYGFETDGWGLCYQTGNLEFCLAEGFGGQAVSGSFTPTVGTWYHIAAVRTGTLGKIFVDGTSIVSNTLDASSPYTNTVYIGGKSTNSRWSNTRMDEIRISNVARWTSNFTPQADAY